MNSPYSSPSETLTVIDNRTGKQVTIPITNNSIPATAFNALKAPIGDGKDGKRQEDDLQNGIRVYDPGFFNTAAIKSKITYIDGDKGELRHRGLSTPHPLVQNTTDQTQATPSNNSPKSPTFSKPPTS